MELRSIKAFEQRWSKLKKLAAAQLKDFERDQKAVAKQIKQYKVSKDLKRAREAVAHSRRVEQAVKVTRTLLKTKDRAVREASKRGRLLKRALT
jgi:predicted DNA-binding WGR domain protein